MSRFGLGSELGLVLRLELGLGLVIELGSCILRQIHYKIESRQRQGSDSDTTEKR